MALSKKGKNPTKTATRSKVTKARSRRAKPDIFTDEEVLFYMAIKNGKPKFDWAAVGNALGKSEDAARMQVSRLMKKIEEFLGEDENEPEDTQPENETSATQEGDETPAEASNTEEA
ncbi:unnamed protein product [Penicillium glandicola]